MRALSSATLLAATVLLTAAPATGQTNINWTGGGSTPQWNERNNWAGGDVPSDTSETARFDVAGSFPVDLPSSVLVSDVHVLQGLPQLRPTTGLNPVVTINDDLALVVGGGMFLSVPGGEKLTINIGDALRVDGGGGLTVDATGDGLVTINTFDLKLVDSGLVSGTIGLIGQGALLQQDGAPVVNIAQNGVGELSVSSRARADFTATVQLANNADPNAAATVLVDSGGRIDFAALQLATSGSNAGVTASLTVTGTNSRVTTDGAMTIGGSSAPTATVTASNSGRIDIGGAATINPSGTLVINGGTVNANGGLDASAGTMSHTDGLLKVTGGAFVPIDTATSTEYRIEGADGPQVTIGAGGTLDIDDPVLVGMTERGALRVEGGGRVDILGRLDVSAAGSSESTLAVVGATTELTALQDLNVGIDSGGDGYASIEAGAAATFANVHLGEELGSDGELLVTGPGTHLQTQGNQFGGDDWLRVAGRGRGTLRVENEAVVDVGVLLLANGGHFSDPRNGVATLSVDNAELNVEEFLSAAPSGTADIEVSGGGAIRIGDYTQLREGAEVTILSGGTFETGSFVASGGTIHLLNGTLSVTDPDQTVLVDVSGIHVGGQEINTDPSTAFSTYVPGTIYSGQLVTVAGTVAVAPAAVLRLQAGGDMTAGGLAVSPGGRVLVGSSSSDLVVNGPVSLAVGSKLESFSDLSLGDPNAVNGVLIAGEVEITLSNRTITLHDANDAVLDSGALVDIGTNGDLIAANGLTIDFGANVVGYGAITTPDDPTKPVINNGHIAGESLGQPITLTGYVKGVGTCDNCVVTGTDAPGFSPATVQRGSVAYRGTLEIEVGGTSSGEHDRIDHVLGDGVIDLGGTLDVQPIGGFWPRVGDEIIVMSSIGGVFNAFDTVNLPEPRGGVSWELHYGETIVALSAVGLEGDYNYDGVVDAADYTVYRDQFGLAGDGLDADGNGDGLVDQLDHGVWADNYGATVAVAPAAVPEPSAALLTLLLLSAGLRRR